MTSYLPERWTTSFTDSQSTHCLHKVTVTDAHNSQQPMSQESATQPCAQSGANTTNETGWMASPVIDLSELWKLSAYKQLEGWRRSGP